MLFDFWKRLPPGEHVHPEDRVMLGRFSGLFELDMPPGQINGRLRTAPEVACFPTWGRRVPPKKTAARQRLMPWKLRRATGGRTGGWPTEGRLEPVFMLVLTDTLSAKQTSLLWPCLLSWLSPFGNSLPPM
jgi:hypothetical protein